MDYFLEEIEPVMQTEAWRSTKETRLYLIERAKERARSRYAERTLPKLRGDL